MQRLLCFSSNEHLVKFICWMAGLDLICEYILTPKSFREVVKTDDHSLDQRRIKSYRTATEQFYALITEIDTASKLRQLWM